MLASSIAGHTSCLHGARSSAASCTLHDSIFRRRHDEPRTASDRVIGDVEGTAVNVSHFAQPVHHVDSAKASVRAIASEPTAVLEGVGVRHIGIGRVAHANE